jgi:hypothetical protein
VIPLQARCVRPLRPRRHLVSKIASKSQRRADTTNEYNASHSRNQTKGEHVVSSSCNPSSFA